MFELLQKERVLMNENNINVQGGNIKQGNSSLGIAALILTLWGVHFYDNRKNYIYD